MFSTAIDLTRSKADLIAENALLRQPLIVLHRQMENPHSSLADRLWLVLLASRVKNWKEALLLLKPDTLLRWHRQGFRRFWRFKSRRRVGRPLLAPQTVALIQPMARDNRRRGAERICGELLRLGFPVAKRTIQSRISLFVPRSPPRKRGAFS